MRLTTRLMQIASWLLLQRAVNQGEITRAQAASDKHKVRLSQQELASNPDVFAHLPQKLRDLAIHSLRLQARVIHLDQLIYGRCGATLATRRSSPVEAQLQQLRNAFAPGLEAIPSRGATGKTTESEKSRAERGFLARTPAYFLPKDILPKRELKRDRRPPRSSSCAEPPVQAGCVFGSMSRLRCRPRCPRSSA